MRPLRFCHLTTFYPPHNFGGDGIGIQRLCRALARRGHAVEVVYDAEAYDALSGGRPPAPTGEEPPGLTTTPLRSGRGKLSLLATQQLGRPVFNGPAIRALLARGRFDVINYHNTSLVGGPGLYDYGDGIKLHMAHEHWLVCESHVLWRHGRELCTGRECLRCVLHHKRPPQPWRYTGLLARKGRQVDAFIAMSEFSRSKHREYGFPFEMEVLPYFLPDPPDTPVGGDPAPDQPASEDAPHPITERPHTRPYFLFVGRLEVIKGLQDVIPVFERYANADLVIAGDGDYAAKLKQLAGNNPRVHFLGRVAPDDLARYYEHAEALIVPSNCYETFGIILIEAFRQRTPVIARRIGPLPEIVEQADAGDLFSNTEELVQAMERIQADQALRQARAQRAYDAYLDRYCERKVIPRYLDIIRRAAARKGRADVLEALGPQQEAS